MPASVSRLREIWRNKTKQKHLILFEMFVVFLYICTEKEREKVNKRKVVTKFSQHKRAQRDDKRV